MKVSLDASEKFQDRHLGPSSEALVRMAAAVGVQSLEDLINETIPASIRLKALPEFSPALSETELLAHLSQLAAKNKIFKSYIGTGYHGTHTPSVILRNILENPGWYTQYTPYQAEISQGRLEALLNFQTMVTDLTGLDIANASLLDEATAAAEAMTMMHRLCERPASRFLVSHRAHPQTIDLLKTRAEPLNIELVVSPIAPELLDVNTFGALLQYPDTDGAVINYAEFCAAAKEKGVLVAAATDLLSLTLLKPPGEWGADIALGSAQRFGVSLGYGGPHAAFFACRESHKRQMPGRLIGVSVDAAGGRALRMALQTREQHIRREKATSNICTAQVLLSIMAGMYAVYHGPKGLKAIAGRVHGFAKVLSDTLSKLGYSQLNLHYFDTLKVSVSGVQRREKIRALAIKAGINFRYHEESAVSIALDETVTATDLALIAGVFTEAAGELGRPSLLTLPQSVEVDWPVALRRETPFLTHSVFNRHHTETDMLRYIKSLENKDLSLTGSMIPLGSCTMKLNATAEMIPVTWPGFAQIHPFAPREQALGYREMIERLEKMLCGLTGFSACSLQPNAGSQGEYAGLLVIRAFHRAQGEANRNLVLIPASAHGTNPASAIMAGMEVVVVACDTRGNIDLNDLQKKAELHKAVLAGLMVTYPSTHGVFEATIQEVCRIIHAHGGQVYMDGANMNAQVGLTSPANIGADLCHINLHKTFCIPHGGGGPGMGPICVAKHLAPFLPGHPIVKTGGEKAITSISAAPWGSASILLISYAYIMMMGAEGLKRATQIAILNANYLAARLKGHYSILYAGENGRVAHEFILDLRPLKATSGVEAEDVAKRLMDYGFHAPTLSFPVPGTLMIEPTESESHYELDRFVEALLSIRAEIREVEEGKADRKDNVLKNAPHSFTYITRDPWPHAYSRDKAVFPVPGLKHNKYWPPVSRVDNAFGDRNLVCACPPVEAYAGA